MKLLNIDFKYYHILLSLSLWNENEISLVLFSYDYVEVYDGLLPTDRKLGRYCQQSQISTVTSTSNNMYIKFRSDYSGSQGGFHVRYFAGRF